MTMTGKDDLLWSTDGCQSTVLIDHFDLSAAEHARSHSARCMTGLALLYC